MSTNFKPFPFPDISIRWFWPGQKGKFGNQKLEKLPNKRGGWKGCAKYTKYIIMIWYHIRSHQMLCWIIFNDCVLMFFWSYCIHFIVTYATYCFLHVIVDTCVCIHTTLHFFKRHIHIILFIYSAIVYSWSYMIYMTDCAYHTFYSIYNILLIYCTFCSNEVVRHNFKCSFATDDYVLSETFLGSENVVVFLRVTSPRTVWSPTKSIHQVDLHRPTQIDQDKLTWVDQSQYHHVIQLDS